ncbi:YtxH domain-containing protein [Desulfovibrio sp. UCD-KL4C]|uniref:YtxH domain-containing protein n=1 Tax=Desulfovibrio sp. UCD-KL4C TaxID=2578120 RepID=UPI0025C241ED|nr:YtxH domain-containing protein [Desulfovibrio sp. UCD-KL4C]
MTDNNYDYTYYNQDPRLINDQQQVDVATQVQPVQAPIKSWVNVTDSRYLKGFAVGAAVAIVASNPTVQKAVVSGSVKLWAALQGGIEEAKEKLQDIKAEVDQS